MAADHAAEQAALPPVCILAGGLGTRLAERVRDTPKPLLEVAGEPFLWHQLRSLAAHGAAEIVLCVGYLGDSIERSVGCARFDLRVSYSCDGPGLDGTLGAIMRARELLGERFLVLYGDTYLRIDYRAAAAAWIRSGLPAMMSVLRNDGRWDTSNAVYSAERVLAYDKYTPQSGMRWIDYGLLGLSQSALSLAAPGAKDLSGLLHRLAQERLLYGFEVAERFYEIGTPGGLAETDAFLREQQALGSRGGEQVGSGRREGGRPEPAELQYPPSRRDPGHRDVSESAADDLGDRGRRKLQRGGVTHQSSSGHRPEGAEQAALDGERERRDTGLHRDKRSTWLEHPMGLADGEPHIGERV
jgi:molybdopterin-guanine dinucleotide biosynthesis protein A